MVLSSPSEELVSRGWESIQHGPTARAFVNPRKPTGRVGLPWLLRPAGLARCSFLAIRVLLLPRPVVFYRLDCWIAKERRNVSRNILGRWVDCQIYGESLIFRAWHMALVSNNPCPQAQRSRLIIVIAFLCATSLFFRLNMRNSLDFGALFPRSTTGNYSFVPQMKIYRLLLAVCISTRDAIVGGTPTSPQPFYQTLYRAYFRTPIPLENIRCLNKTQ